ncbi:hypothetical protein BV22DRAFT_1118490 [Leucogyrophana mollusca]|uniref:Uncharacterized protein n=1 Tax=Leucogyrophana mollusca TaxID=85980 RepID=A0ACB8BMF8_9AGAM|nr:hypothetical protein BV22DRAFT_1118490 [Leucogyrophana mollusca]
MQTSQSRESLVEERVAQLEEISRRRNELLRQMYHMMRRRHNAESVLAFNEDDDEDLHMFLDQYNIEKNPESGLVSNIPQSELFALSPPQQQEERAQSKPGSTASEHGIIDVDSPMSEPPVSPHTGPSTPHKEPESDDPLEVSVPEGSPPQVLPQQEDPVDQGDADELNLVGYSQSQTASRSPTGRRSRSATQQSSRSRTFNSESPKHIEEETAEDPPATQDAREAIPMKVDREVTPELLLPGSSPLVTRRTISRTGTVSNAVDVVQLQSSLFIPAPSSPGLGLPGFSFDEVEPGNTEVPPPPSPTELRHHFDPQYTLPPIKSLPADYIRKGKSAKQRKRDKEREKDKSDPKNKEEWALMGLNKWGAAIRANPIWKKVSRASKCLSTREWSVAITELRLARTLERIESLENVAKWSYRQPKKHSRLGGQTKTHWDYLMDEMKWMRVDFREERRWKYVLAFNLSTAVLEWHAAGSHEERLKLGICVLWKRPQVSDEDKSGPPQDMVVDQPIDLADAGYTPMADDSDNDDDDADGEQRDIMDPLETGNALEEALEGATSAENSQRQSSGPEQIQPKVEDMDDSSALQGSAMDIDSQVEVGESSETKKEEPSEGDTTGLKPTSTDPLLVSLHSTQTDHSTQADSAPASATPKSAPKSALYAPLRERIAYSDERKLFLDDDDLDLVHALAELTTDDKAPEPSQPPPDLSDIFPDLQPYGLPEVSSGSISSLTENKKKSDKKSDRDDTKRVEDMVYGKVVPFGRFMHCKPTLLGPLQPVKRWKGGKWISAEEPAVNPAEYEGQLGKSPDELACELFDGNKSMNPLTINPSILQPKDAKKRAEHIWSPNEDTLLKTMVERYPNNWTLVADSFNSSRVTISIDKRTPWECFERWNSRWGGINRAGPSSIPPDISSPATYDGTPPPTAPSSQAQMTTRGVKRLASISVAQGQGTGGGSGQSSDTKKRRRHALMFETIKKVAKKRDATQKAALTQRKPSAIHDTHGQYNKMPKLTPAELSRMKAEKETRDQQELILARRRHEDMARQQMMRDSRMQGAQPQPQPAAAGQPQPTNGTPRPAVQAPQGVPQIRTQPVQQVNISQQQRIPTPMASGAARMSPQQMLQAQVAQARMMAAQAQAQAQAQIQGASSTPNANGVPSGSHLSPPYQSRAATSSPSIPQQASPPRNPMVPLDAASSPRPPSAQAQVGSQAPQVTGNPIPRQTSSIPAHYFAVVPPVLTQEQREQALRYNLMHRPTMPQVPQNNPPYPPQS